VGHRQVSTAYVKVSDGESQTRDHNESQHNLWHAVACSHGGVSSACFTRRAVAALASLIHMHCPAWNAEPAMYPLTETDLHVHCSNSACRHSHLHHLAPQLLV
jgi:hypothetical protein